MRLNMPSAKSDATTAQWRSAYGRPVGWAILAATAVDSLLYGLWALLRPDALFELLGTPSPRDGVLWRVYGCLLLTHVPCLVVAFMSPIAAGLPLLGRLLLCCIWLWLLGTERISADPRALAGLLAHDAAAVVALAGVLIFSRGSGSSGRD